MSAFADALCYVAIAVRGKKWIAMRAWNLRRELRREARRWR